MEELEKERTVWALFVRQGDKSHALLCENRIRELETKIKTYQP